MTFLEEVAVFILFLFFEPRRDVRGAKHPERIIIEVTSFGGLGALGPRLGGPWGALDWGALGGPWGALGSLCSP
jgi:hypothetical protein